MRKRIIIRITLIVVLIIIGIFLYVIGKEHIVFIDNRYISISDITYSPDTTTIYGVRLNNQDTIVIKKDERKMTKVIGASHNILVEEIKDNGLIGERYEKSFKLKINESATINIPAIVKDLPWLQVLVIN